MFKILANLSILFFLFLGLENALALNLIIFFYEIGDSLKNKKSEKNS